MDPSKQNWEEFANEDLTVTTPEPQKDVYTSEVDSEGIKTEIKYCTEDGKTTKITRYLKVTEIVKKSKVCVEKRKALDHFCHEIKETQNDDGTTNYEKEMRKPTMPDERTCIKIEIPRNKKINLVTLGLEKDDFFDTKVSKTSLPSSLKNKLTQTKKIYASLENTHKLPSEEDVAQMKAKLSGDATISNILLGINTPYDDIRVGAYRQKSGMPIIDFNSQRNNASDQYSKRYNVGAGGKKILYDHNGRRVYYNESTIKVSNLCDEMDDKRLRDYFSAVGNIVKVVAPVDQNSKCKGYAFIRYEKREDAEKAIAAYNKRGFENLVLAVDWAQQGR